MTRRLWPIAILGLAALLAACDANKSQEPASAPAAGPEPATTVDPAAQALLASLPAPYNTGDLVNGKRRFAQCRSCHTLTEGGANTTGPNLWGLFGRKAGSHPGFNYSAAMKAAGYNWDVEHLDPYIADPKAYMPGNKMTFVGLKDAKDRIDVIAYLKTQTEKPAG